MRKTLQEEQQEARHALDAFLTELFRTLRFPQLVAWLNKKLFK